MEINWSEAGWVKVSCWLDSGLNTDPDIATACGVYELRVSPEYPNKLPISGPCRFKLSTARDDRSVEGGRVQYVGSTRTKNKAKRGSDHFTGLDKRVGQFIICAMGFGTAHKAGRKLYALRECGWSPPSVTQGSGRDTDACGTPWPSVRDVEVRWAVVDDCPLCAERQAYYHMTPPPLFNGKMHYGCGDEGCPHYAAYVQRLSRSLMTPPDSCRNVSL